MNKQIGVCIMVRFATKNNPLVAIKRRGCYREAEIRITSHLWYDIAEVTVSVHLDAFLKSQRSRRTKFQLALYAKRVAVAANELRCTADSTRLWSKCHERISDEETQDCRGGHSYEARL